MTLIKSISGIRGTIGGFPGEGLTPVDIIKFSAAYGTWIREQTGREKNTIVVGRDARVSGEMVMHLITNTLNALGVNVINLGLSSTPTVEMAVTGEKADGGIIITASHNPMQWNALKLLNHKGEFISDKEGKKILQIANDERFNFVPVQQIGQTIENSRWDELHIEKILSLKLVNKKAIENADFSIVFDGINSVGGIILPKLLQSLGVKNITGINTEASGIFAHNPEPLPENVTQIRQKVVETGASAGFVVDPDVDRLAIISEDGSMFGEEYTLVAVADYILRHQKGNTVSNLSSTRALREVSAKNGVAYDAAAVGEVNVVEMMKKTGAVIGGEGNGGIIYPELHYGRDALVGIALFLSFMAETRLKCSELRKTYPSYFMAKNKMELTQGLNPDDVLAFLNDKYKNDRINTVDGLKIDFENAWIHLRKSNTEPIIRIYTEARSQQEANDLALKTMEEIRRYFSL